MAKDIIHENCIVLEHVNKSFGTNRVLKDICLEIPEGIIYGLLGPSGCGKTTTVKIVAGISEATEGETYVFGQLMPDLGTMEKIGYMAQSDALYGALTAEENLQFFGALYGLKKDQMEEKIMAVAGLVNLKDDLDRPVGVYSGGMKRRLSLAGAMLHTPKLLILDEPTVGIDPVLRHSIWLELRKLADNGVTVLITTHVMDEAVKCDRLAMMRDGAIIAKGSPSEIIKASGTETIEDAFLFYGRGGGHNES